MTLATSAGGLKKAAATLDVKRSHLLLIDLQARLMPAIDGGADVVANARRLLQAAHVLDVPALITEQNPAGLGATVPELDARAATVVAKMTFDATRAATFPALPVTRSTIVVAGCEAHVCVLQTVLGLLAAGRHVSVAADATGSRTPASHAAALQRMAAHGAEIVTTEMVIFEWMATAEHPRFKELIALIK